MAATIPLCLGFLTIFLHCVAAQETHSSISAGTSLTASPDAKSWISHSGEFALGFQQPQGNDNFLLSIWYDKIPDKTIIWYPKDGPMVPRGSKAELINRQGLVLSDPQGIEVWSSGSIFDLAYGLMNDTGNFQLVGSDSSTIWESFDHPADTMLPAQIMARGGEINSKMSQTNFSRGRFQLRLLPDGNLVLNTVDMFSGSRSAGDAYYVSGTSDVSNLTNSGEQLIFNATGYLYILRGSGTRFDLTPRDAVPSGNYYHRATLDSDGVFTQYYYSKDSTNDTGWKVLWLEPEDTCSSCGLNSVCSLDGFSPKCECPLGFSLSDPSDPNGVCNPDFAVPICDAGYGEEQFNLTELNDIDWPGSDYVSINPSNEENCKTSCLKDCFCVVAIYRDNRCWKKKLPLSNGMKDPSRVVKAFLKFRKASTDRKKDLHSSFNRKKRQAITITFSISAGLALLGIIFWGKRKMRSDADRQGRPIKTIDKDQGGSSETSIEAPFFSLFRVSNATNNFSVDNKLGEGGFGPVYKGVLEDGQEIAVKRLSKFSRQGLNEFKNEVNCIAKLQHRNLVKLLGYCIQGNETMLIYEYMPNKSLDSFIFDESRKSLLDWPQRFHIIQGIARGLLYLHQDSRLRVVHRDLKAGNVLLDHNMTPKISDFGLARMFKEHESEANTMRVVGTLGYISPEYAANGLFSMKSDIFSFGVLVLEIVSGKKNRGFVSEDHHHNLIGHAWRLYKEDLSLDLIDASVGNSYSVSEVMRSIHIGLLCVQQLAEDRPSAPLVVSMLGGESSMPSPKQPGFFIRGSETVSTVVSSLQSSVNGVTLTQTEGR